MKEGWKIKAFSEICHSIQDGDWIEKKDQSNNGIRLIQTGNIGVGIYRDKSDKAKYISEETFKRLKCLEVVEGDVLISRLPEPVGRACVVPSLTTKSITAVDCSVLKLKSDQVSTKWFIYYTQSNDYFSKCRKECSGTTRDRITRKKLEVITIPIPSLTEQQRIVTLLDAAFAKIDALKANAEKNLQNAKDLFQAALKKELEPKEGWVRKKLSDLYDVRDGTHDSPKYHEKGYPLVTSKNLRDGYVDMGNVKLISKQDYDKINERSKVDVGDVLFAMIGTIGNPTLVVEEPQYAIKNMALFKVPCSQSGAFLRYVLSSDAVIDEMHNKSKGSNQPFVSLGYLRAFEIYIPEDKCDQQSIVSRLDALNERCKQLQENYTKTIALCDDLKQALLTKAFNGEL